MVSKRIENVQSPVIPIVGEWIAAHPGTISLGQGVVHYEPPEAVYESVAHALRARMSLDRYSSVKGREELLARITEKVSRENGLCGSEQSILFTAGSNMGFLNAVLAIADIGDEIILLSPYYFNHRMAVEMAGCRVVAVPTDAEYQIDLPAVRAALTDRTRAIVTISPNNPTGAVYGRESLTAINQFCRESNCYHISDEAYEYFDYSAEPHFSPASLPGSTGHTISLFSMSKAYAMAGWRCGYMVIPQALDLAVKKIQDTNLICPPVISQIAAMAALDEGVSWCQERINGMRLVRQRVLHELGALQGRCVVPRPDGAFYVLIQCETELDDLVLVRKLIEEYRVAVMPGSTFGATKKCALRIAYGALDAHSVEEGVGRLVAGLKELI
jgi:aspartate/methionine/tyrosine aminotransferase